jgi:hypothetical protein
MLYQFLYLVRFYPFWAVPLALVFFEMGTYYYNRRERIGFLFFYGITAMFIITSILWLVFEGYWRAGPFVKSLLTGN